MTILTGPLSIDLITLLVIPLFALLSPRSTTTGSRFGPLHPREVWTSEFACTEMRVNRYLGDLLPLDPHRLA